MGHGHRGFSRPARFEALEGRLSLNIAPAAPTGAPFVAAGSVSGVSGDTGSSPGINPANSSPANTTGSIVLVEGNALENQQVAFNTPYWVPNDRTPFASASPPSDQLPANVNQEANTPYGIRNFNLGSDTSTHFTTRGVTLTVRQPTRDDRGGNKVVKGPLDGASLVAAVLGAESPASPSKESASPERPTGVSWPGSADDSSPTSELVLERSGGSADRKPDHLEAKAVDRMMADQSEADAALVEVAAEDPATVPVAHGVAASLAAAMSVPIRGEARSERSPR
ncbi:MAG TPA: hypothetical protein VG826_10780 [Pirellulales bacterium]|nr:hypothetical protein [Pirellulales bacterium]